MMSCPRPNRDCYLCEMEALEVASEDAEIEVSDDCACGCSLVVCNGEATCIGCGEEVEWNTT